MLTSGSERGEIVSFTFLVKLRPTIGNASWYKRNTPLSIKAFAHYMYVNARLFVPLGSSLIAETLSANQLLDNSFFLPDNKLLTSKTSKICIRKHDKPLVCKALLPMCEIVKKNLHATAHSKSELHQRPLRNNVSHS